MPKSALIQPKTGADYIDELTRALEGFGFSVEPDPVYEGSDTAAIVFSKTSGPVDKYYELCEKYLEEKIDEEEFEAKKDRISGLGFAVQDWKHLDIDGEKEYLKKFGIRVRELSDGLEISVAAAGKELVARWESKSGKHWVELYSDAHGFSYRAPGAGGSFGAMEKTQALRALEQRIQEGYFMSDDSKTPMKRVK